MARNRVLVVGPLLDFALADLERHFDVQRVPQGIGVAALPSDDAQAVEALVLAAAVDTAFIESFPRLRIIANFGVGYDNLPVQRCAELGIIVVNTPDVLSADVADTAVALVLLAVRHFSAAERYLRAGRWAAEGIYPLTPSLTGRRIGVLGFGRIGRTIARRFSGFDAALSYCDVAPHAESTATWYGTATELAANVDVLVAALPGGEATRRMVNAAVLAALGPDGIFVNVGRGTAVDQSALIDALRQRTIAAAGLDVYESEPNLPAELLALDNAVLLPHMASGTTASRQGMSRLVTDNLVAFFTTGRALTPVPETPNPA